MYNTPGKSSGRRGPNSLPKRCRPVGLRSKGILAEARACPRPRAVANASSSSVVSSKAGASLHITHVLAAATFANPWPYKQSKKKELPIWCSPMLLNLAHFHDAQCHSSGSMPYYGF